MIDLQLPAGVTLDAFHAVLATSHRIRIRVTLLSSNEGATKGFVPWIASGAVQVDASAAVTRSLELTCIDPDHALQFDKSSPAAGAFYADNFIAVTYGVEVEPGVWVDVPVFTGPVTGYSRQGAEVTVEAQGKEALALDPHLVTNGYNLHRNRRVADAVQDVMGRLGEQHYSLGMVQGRLSRHRAVARGEAPWVVLVGGGQDGSGNAKPALMSKASGHPLLFYDGRGTLTAKRRGGRAVYDFTDQSVTSQPGYSYDVLEARNRVYVEGGTPKKSKRHYTGTATLPSSHPLSAQSLARHGHPRYLTTMVQSDTLRSDHACHQHAQVVLGQLSGEGLDASFECLPVPHLEESDPVRLIMDGYVISFPLRTFTIPLTHDTAMSIGAPVRVPLRRRHRRGRR